MLSCLRQLKSGKESSPQMRKINRKHEWLIDVHSIQAWIKETLIKPTFWGLPGLQRWTNSIITNGISTICWIGSSHCGAMETNLTHKHEVAVRYLALLSGLRNQHCHELGCRSQMRLGSCIAVGVALKKKKGICWIAKLVSSLITG